MLQRMVSQAIAADLGKALMGDYGKTGKVGGSLGSVVGFWAASSAARRRPHDRRLRAHGSGAGGEAACRLVFPRRHGHQLLRRRQGCRRPRCCPAAPTSSASAAQRFCAWAPWAAASSQPRPGCGRGGDIKVNVINNAGASVSVGRDDNGDIQIMLERAAEQGAARQLPCRGRCRQRHRAAVGRAVRRGVNLGNAALRRA